MRKSLVFCALLTLVLAASPALAAYRKATISLAVGVTAPRQHVFYVTEGIPVTPGPLTLYYPQYIPGEHFAAGPIADVGGLVFTANGQTVAWRRDPVDMYTFYLDVPEGASTLTAQFQYLSPIGGGVALTPYIMDLEWNRVVFYPAGFASKDLTFKPSITIPAQWQYASALVTASAADGHVSFAPVSLNNLVDSPMIAGKYFREVDLSPGNPVQHYLDIVAAYPQALDLGAARTEEMRNLVVQAQQLFDSHHYQSYRFLLVLSDPMSSGGLEHHQSSDNTLFADLLTNQEKFLGEASLMPHEYVHSWNGKFRRPAQLWQPNFQIPEHSHMLWVYEGLTDYWGPVLAARSGLFTQDQYHEFLAYTASGMVYTTGRQWRPLVDTALTTGKLHGGSAGYGNWLRGGDYYPEGDLIWLGVDTKIRELTHNQRSLDDFAKSFYGMDNGSYVTLTYTFDDIVKALNAVAPYDWARYLHERVDAVRDHAPLAGITRGGWKLVYTDQPNAYEQARAVIHDFTDVMSSVGLMLGRDGNINDVLWNGPAFKAGLAPGMQIVSVNGATYNNGVLLRAIAATAQPGEHKLTIVASQYSVTATYTIDYSGGLRYPHLERVAGMPDYLDEIIAPVKG
ncbi:MAG: M61 family metallopeptidase [Gammaproteobacteria bacterium]